MKLTSNVILLTGGSSGIGLELVDTPWHDGNPPKIAISTKKAVDEMLKGLEKRKQEIHVGGVKKLRTLSRIAPEFAFRKINSLA